MNNRKHCTRRDFLRTAAAGAAVAAVSPWISGPAHAAEARRPNVIIVLSDDQGYADFSCHGHPILRTPNLDRLHGESIRFEDFHVAPMCTPTRGQLMTGLDALHNRACSVTAGRTLMRRDAVTLPQYFARHGYRTGIFGKWHLGDSYPDRPQDRGFQKAVWHLGWGVSSAVEFDNDCVNPRYRDGETVRQAEGYCTDVWFDAAMTWMDECRARNEPFLCYIPTNAPHAPHWAKPEDEAKYRGKGRDVPAAFFGMIANIDDNMGRLDAWLKEKGLREQTIVIYMNDNGGTAGTGLYNAGLRGKKTGNYEGSHRAACFLRWPGGGLGAPRAVRAPAQIQDLYPTLAELCGLGLPEGAKLDGMSLAPVLRDPAGLLPERMLIVQYGQNPSKFDACIIWNHWRLVGGRELYDLAADPGQKTNAAAAQPAVMQKMRAHYEQWWAGVEPTLKDYVPIVVGAPEENPVHLCSGDWEVVYCDNTGHVGSAAGGPRGSKWNIQVEREGEYEIELRRWPFHTNCALGSAGPQKTVSGRPLGHPGKRIPVASACLQVAGLERTAAATAADLGVTMKVRLPAGRTQLQGWFRDAEGRDLCGAFYARVKRL